MSKQPRSVRKVSASTKWAVEYPAVFALMGCVGVAVGTWIEVGDLRAVAAMAIVAPVVGWLIWRPKGPIARRVRERMKVEEGENS